MREGEVCTQLCERHALHLIGVHYIHAVNHHIIPMSVTSPFIQIETNCSTCVSHELKQIAVRSPYTSRFFQSFWLLCSTNVEFFHSFCWSFSPTCQSVNHIGCHSRVNVLIDFSRKRNKQRPHLAIRFVLECREVGWRWLRVRYKTRCVIRRLVEGLVKSGEPVFVNVENDTHTPREREREREREIGDLKEIASACS